MRCPRCQAQKDETARFCGECGTRQELTQPSFGQLVGAGNFCRSCGASLRVEPGRSGSPGSETPTGADEPGNPQGDVRLARALHFIKQHYRGKLTLQAVAREAGMGKFTLSHEFTAALHISFRAYLLRLRVAKATELLSGDTTYSVTDIAEMVGFGDLSRFNKAFKKLTRVTPTAYRTLQEQETPKKRARNA